MRAGEAGSGDLRRSLMLGAAVAAAYVLTAQAGFRLALVAEQVTTVWAPTGIAIAALLLFGVRLWPAVWAGAFLANAGAEAPLWTAGAIATGNTLEALVATVVLRRVPRFDAGFARVADALWFLVVAVLACTMVSATIGVLTLCAAGVQPWDRFGVLWSDWWLGDAVGAAIVAPALLAGARHAWTARAAARVAIAVAGAMTVSHLVFGPFFDLSLHPFEYLTFPLVVAAAVSGGPPMAALVVLGTSVVALWHTVAGSGPFAGTGLHASLVLLQVFLGVLAGTALLLAAGVAERRASERRERDAAAGLRQRDEMLTLAQRASGVGTFEWDFRNQVAYCSAEFFRIFGLPAREGTMTATRWGQYVHPDDRDRMAAHLQEALAGTEPAAADYRITAADGRTRWVSYMGRIQATSRGDRMLGTVLDITDRKRLEAELRRHGEEVEHILESLGEGFTALDRELRYVYVNRQAEQMLGRSRKELIGRSPWDVFPADVVQVSRDELAAAMASGSPAHFEVHVPRWDRWYENRVYPSATGLSIFFADVTARVASDRELRRRMLEQETLLDVLPIGIGIATDPECRRILTNRAFAATLGLPPDANASMTAPAGERPTNFRVLTPEGGEMADEDLPMQVAAREGRALRDIELDLVHADGRVVRLLEYAAPLVDEQGVPRGAVGAFVDVTAAHRARATLARSERRYRRIFDTAGVSLWEEDFSAVKIALDRLREQGENLPAYLERHPEFVDECLELVRVVDVNDATLRICGAPDKETLLGSLARVLGPETRAVFVGELLAIWNGQPRFESEAALRTFDGRPIHVLVTLVFPGPGEPLESVLVCLSDITDRNVAETALRQELEVRTALARVGASLAGELRSEKLVQAVTDAATRLTEAEFGAFFYHTTDEKGDSYPLHALSGAPREAFATFPPPRATEVFGPTFRGEAVVRLDDVTRDARYGRNPPYQGMPPGHLPVRSYLAVPVVGRDGIVLGGLFFGHSQPAVFTERHEQLAAGVAGWAAIALDNARLYREAEEANRLKDEFLAVVSHELRTPLNAVLGWAQLLRTGEMPPAMQPRALESVERNARAQAQLLDDLLDVSRITAGKLQVRADAVDLGTVVNEAVDTVRAGASAKGLRLDVDVPPDRRLIVTGDADRLRQVVWNLVANAIKFTPTGGRVGVELRQADSEAEIVVRDTGQGIAPSFQPYLFQRFRQMDSSKARMHGGLGIGLSIVRQLTEAHGGTVGAESEGEGRGATFRVRLPLRAVEEAVPGRTTDRGQAADPALAGVRALVVDDDADARELMQYVLEARGAHVVTAASAGDALRVLAASPFDVLIADLAMPHQDGIALIRMVRSLPGDAANRRIPAIAVTAHAGVRERDAALAAGFDWHLGKPVDPDQLIASIAMSQR